MLGLVCHFQHSGVVVFTTVRALLPITVRALLPITLVASRFCIRHLRLYFTATVLNWMPTGHPVFQVAIFKGG